MDPCKSTFPSLDTENTVSVKLSGRNESTAAEVDGWSHSWAERYTGLTYKDVIRSVDAEFLEHLDEDQNGNSRRGGGTSESYFANPEYALTFRRRYPTRKPLQQLMEEEGHSGLPAFVTVIAKKQLELVITEAGTALVFGQVIVADESGICILKFINTAIQKAYRLINIGDRLMVGVAPSTLLAARELDYCPNFGISLDYLPCSLKINDAGCGFMFRIVDRENEVNSISHFLSPSHKRLYNPSSITDLPRSDSAGIDKDVADIIGVLSHVSRFERRRRYLSPVVLPDDTLEHDFFQFIVSCWIEVVDSQSEHPIPVLLYLSSLIWPKRHELIPGSLIVITNVQYSHDKYFYSFVHTTSFSHIYTNIGVKEYRILMEKSGKRGMKAFLGIENSTAILKRKDVTWSVGGAYPLPVTNVSRFYELYSNPPATTTWSKVPTIPIHRRESQLLIFKATLLRYNLFETNFDCDFSEWTWVNSEAIKNNNAKRRRKGGIFDPLPVDTVEQSPLWFLWKRKLPAFEFPKSKGKESKVFAHRVQIYTNQEQFAGFTQAISMPVNIGKDLRKLKAIDGAPHYAVDVWNEDSSDERFKKFILTWKPSRHVPITQIGQKLQNLQNSENVIIVAQIHRTESVGVKEAYGHDLMVHDILPLPPNFHAHALTHALHSKMILS